MSNISLKWIDFANKYLALPNDSKSVWMEKLSLEQQKYLKLVLIELTNSAKKNTLISKTALNFDLKPRVSSGNTTIEPSSILKPKPASNLIQAQNTSAAAHLNLASKPRPKETPAISMEFPSSKLQTCNYPQFSASVDQNKPKTLSMSVIMPAKKFDLGIATKSAKTLNQAKPVGTASNLSKKEYLKQKAGKVVKNTIVQAILAALVLAIPIAGVVFALNNSNSVKAIGSGKKSITQVLSDQSFGQKGVSDLEFKVWMADYKDLKDQDKTVNSDPDQDGLTNLEEFNFETIPNSAYTCNNSKLDGENILAQIDPVTCKPINFNDPSVAAKFDGVISRSKINYRLSAVALDKFLNPKPGSEPDLRAKTTETDTADFSIDYSQNAALVIKAANPVFKADQQYDIAWTQSTAAAQLLDRVDKQIVAYPTKAIPGKAGNLYLSGKAQFKTDSKEISSAGVDIFAKLDHLEPGDTLILSLKTTDGKSKSFIYKVQTQNLFLASDPKQFRTSKIGRSELTLATPWTTSSPDQRLLVRAVLDSAL